MRIAIFGATSEIAKDLILSFTAKSSYELTLYARRPEAVRQWLRSVNMEDRYPISEFSSFDSTAQFAAIINFVGVGNPVQAVAMGASIFDVTLKFDEIALDYVRSNPTCRYIFLSSGAAYGSTFEVPVNEHTRATFSINNLQPQDWYTVSKMHAECRHRSLAPLPIVDVRIFNFFSCNQDMTARFLLTDIVRALQSNERLRTSASNITRDYLGKEDFYQLIVRILQHEPTNISVDCYSKAPIDKMSMLNSLESRFGLSYELSDDSIGINSTGAKKNYYSMNYRALQFGYAPQQTSLELILQELAILTKCERAH